MSGGWFAYFTLCASVGTFGVLAFLPVRPIGKGYFRTIGIVALALAGVTATAVRIQPPYILHPFLAPFPPEPEMAARLPRTPDGYVDFEKLGSIDKIGGSHAVTIVWIAIGSLLLVALALHPRACAGVESVGRTLRASGVILGILLLILPCAFLHDRLTLHAVGQLASACVLGLALDTMLLGHWYLNVPNLSFEYLKNCSMALVVAIGIRGLVSGLALWLGWNRTRGDLWGHYEIAFSHFTYNPFEWIIFSVRFLFGMAAALVFAILAWRCAKIHSNQSATGILYVVLFFVVVGEMTGAYLLGRTGLPL